jgi:hypothetical protein
MTKWTHRPLPEEADLGRLDDAERQAVAEGWRRRARNELSTSTVFASLTRTLVALGAPHEIVLACAQAVADEVRHAEICVRVARAYWPEVRGPDPSRVFEVPELEERGGTGAIYFAVQQSCVNEGVATVYLQRCIDETNRPLVRAALRDILQDEIHHARFGWALVASNAVTASFRRALAESLPVMLEQVAFAWITGDGDAPLAPGACGSEGHGLIAQAALGAVVREAFEGLVIPGFDAVGVDTKPARAWAETYFGATGASP